MALPHSEMSLCGSVLCVCGLCVLVPLPWDSHVQVLYITSSQRQSCSQVVRGPLNAHRCESVGLFPVTDCQGVVYKHHGPTPTAHSPHQPHIHYPQNQPLLIFCWGKSQVLGHYVKGRRTLKHGLIQNWLKKITNICFHFDKKNCPVEPH